MKAILLAAGRGTRISRHIQNKPKCMVNIGNSTLIEYTLNLLKNNNIHDITLILGYESKKIRKLLEGKDVKFYYNPFYDVTNSLASLWFAKEEIHGDDILIMNADVFIEQDVMDIILKEDKTPVLFSDETKIDSADYRFYYNNGILEKYGKNLTKDETTGEYVGIAKLEKKFLPEFVNKLEEKIAMQHHSQWWEDVLYDMTGYKDIYVKDVDGKFWAEVDYIEDYEKILSFVKSVYGL